MGVEAARSLALCAVAAASLALGAAATAAGGERTEYTLATALSLRPPHTGDVSRRTLLFTLPRQSDSAHYGVRLRFRIRFQPGAGDGFADVSAATNGLTSALVEFAHRGRSATVEATSVSLAQGRSHARYRLDRSIVVDYWNFVRSHGLREGRNTLTFQVEQHGALRVARVEALPGAGVIFSEATAPSLVLRPLLGDERVRAGESFDLSYELMNRGGLAARDVSVAAVVPDALAVDGAAVQSLGAVRDGSRGTFSILARRPGRHRIVLAVDSSANRPAAEIAVQVAGAAPAGIGDDKLLWSLAAAPIAALLAFRWRRPDPSARAPAVAATAGSAVCVSVLGFTSLDLSWLLITALFLTATALALRQSRSRLWVVLGAATLATSPVLFVGARVDGAAAVLLAGLAATLLAVCGVARWHYRAVG